MLIIIILIRIREVLHRWIDPEVPIQTDRMGLLDELESTGSATFRATVDGRPIGDAGGDSTAHPYSQRPGGLNLSTLVVEAGQSETLELRRDVRWWLGASNHAVKVVLPAKFDHAQRKIPPEKWVEVQGVSPRGASTTGAAAQLRPF